MALLHVCTFRWRRYELQAVLLNFCNWALIRDSLIRDRRSSASGKEEEFKSCLPAFQPNTFITRLEVRTGELGPSCFGQGLVQVCSFLYFSNAFLIAEFFHTIKNPINKFTSCFLHCCLTGFLFAPFLLCPCPRVWDYVVLFSDFSSLLLMCYVLLPTSVCLAEKHSWRGTGLYRCELGWETFGLWITVGQMSWCQSAPQHKEVDSSSNAPNG